MKKLVLGLFLVLTAMSFSAPRFVDVNGIKRKKYRIIADTDIGFSYLAKNSESGKYISLSYYYGRDKDNPKSVNTLLKKEFIEGIDLEYMRNYENSRYYVTKYYNREEEIYAYLAIGKNPKIKNCYVAVLYLTPENFGTKTLNYNINVLLDEAESFLIKS